MEETKAQINAVINALEAGEITEEDAHIRIAEITTDIPAEDRISDAVREYMLGEIAGMPITDVEKAVLRADLDEQ